MRSMSEIMAEVNAQVAASRFTRIACGAAPGGGADEAKIVKETRTVTRFRGLGRAARELGVSRGHLSYVLHGQRKPGKELERKLRRLGIRLGIAVLIVLAPSLEATAEDARVYGGDCVVISPDTVQSIGCVCDLAHKTATVMSLIADEATVRIQVSLKAGSELCPPRIVWSIPLTSNAWAQAAVTARELLVQSKHAAAPAVYEFTLPRSYEEGKRVFFTFLGRAGEPVCGQWWAAFEGIPRAFGEKGGGR